MFCSFYGFLKFGSRGAMLKVSDEILAFDHQFLFLLLIYGGFAREIL